MVFKLIKDGVVKKPLTLYEDNSTYLGEWLNE